MFLYPMSIAVLILFSASRSKVESLNILLKTLACSLMRVSLCNALSSMTAGSATLVPVLMLYLGAVVFF